MLSLLSFDYKHSPGGFIIIIAFMPGCNNDRYQKLYGFWYAVPSLYVPSTWWNQLQFFNLYVHTVRMDFSRTRPLIIIVIVMDCEIINFYGWCVPSPVKVIKWWEVRKSRQRSQNMYKTSSLSTTFQAHPNPFYSSLIEGKLVEKSSRESAYPVVKVNFSSCPKRMYVYVRGLMVLWKTHATTTYARKPNLKNIVAKW